MYICGTCDAQSIKWSGKCLECDSWGTLKKEEATIKGSSSSVIQKTPAAEVVELQKQISNQSNNRFTVGVQEIDRVIGGGLVPGSLVLLSGEPGIGKSTLVAGIVRDLGKQGKESLYVSGEESGSQLRSRFERLGGVNEKILYLEVKPVEILVATMEKEKPDFVVIDSVQTLTSLSMDSAPGTPALVRYATSLLLEFCKRSGITILLVGQVTKDGSVAGPKTLEHLVDVVLSLDGDATHSYRFLVSTKNRFGPTDEIGVFEMASTGLLPVENPSAQFLKDRVEVPGSVVTATVEGSRVFLVEVQALVDKSAYGTPVRKASGFDHNRLQMMIAILSKRAGLKLSDQDVYINVIGGMRLKEPAADLAVCAAITSALLNTSFDQATMFLGEVGLGGEVRPVPFLDKRKKEAERLGINSIHGPKEIKHVKDLK